MQVFRMTTKLVVMMFLSLMLSSAQAQIGEITKDCSDRSLQEFSRLAPEDNQKELPEVIPRDMFIDHNQAIIQGAGIDHIQIANKEFKNLRHNSRRSRGNYSGRSRGNYRVSRGHSGRSKGYEV